MSWSIIHQPEKPIIPVEEFETYLRYTAEDDQERAHMVQCLLAAENYVGCYHGMPIQCCTIKWSFPLKRDKFACIPISSIVEENGRAKLPVPMANKVLSSRLFINEQWVDMEEGFCKLAPEREHVVLDRTKIPKNSPASIPIVELKIEAGYSKRNLPKIIKITLLQVAAAYFDGRTDRIRAYLTQIEAYRPKKIV